VSTRRPRLAVSLDFDTREERRQGSRVEFAQLEEGVSDPLHSIAVPGYDPARFLLPGPEPVFDPVPDLGRQQADGWADSSCKCSG